MMNELYFTQIPMITFTSGTFFLILISIIVLGGLAVAGYLVFTAVYSDLKYRGFELPVDEKYIYKDEEKSEEIINPVKESRFNIEQKTGNDFIDKSRDTSEEMFRQQEARMAKRAKQEAKRLKKELAKKAEK